MPAKKKRVSAKVKRSSKKKAANQVIRIHGARQNNLKGFDLEIPLHQLTVVTGPSGSGKSSLAFQTIYAEGQRRYVETFSPYTRQFFDRMDKPQVEDIEGIPPAIAIEQTNNVKTTRSTVGSITEVNDYLKLYFPKVAEANCPDCGRRVEPDHPTSIATKIKDLYAGKQVLLTFGVPVPPKTKVADFFEFLQQQGYLRVWLFGEAYRTDEPSRFKRKKLPAVVDVIQDRLKVAANQSGRLLESLETALQFGKGQLRVTDTTSGEATEYSSGWHCPACDRDIRPPSPGLFNFNHPLGACQSCRGFGRTIGLDLEKALPDPSLSIEEGVVAAFRGSNYQECQTDLLGHAALRGIDIHAPFEDLSAKDQEWVLYGEQGPDGDAEESWRESQWYGVQGFFDWLEQKVYKMHVRIFLSRYRSYTTCRACHGGRLQPEALNFRYDGQTLPCLWQMSIEDLVAFFDKHPPNTADPSAELLYEQITSRLRYLDHIGLSYLTLDRPTRSLSGGELQRVNLTTCLGASLVNTLFVLDEPSIGLHPRDIGRLIQLMEGLRDKGNTLVVVEHEEAVIRSADHLVDIGPGRGAQGGELLYAGPAANRNKAKSLTIDYLSGAIEIPVPRKRRKTKKSASIVIKGARQHNLRALDVIIPLGVLCVVTGVSGSGKSTLIHHVLYRNLLRQRGERTEEEPGRVKSVTVNGAIDQLVMVDQSPLSRTPRSTPAVYIGVFDLIRKLFTASPDAKSRGLTMGYFSFNSGAGRCERCSGSGYEKVEMQFLSDLFVTCPECEGRRYHPEALKVRLEDRSIADVLEMTVDEARTFFEAMSGKAAAAIVSALQTLTDVGLGYLPMGRPLNTLSGGEAQRLKLVGHLLAKESQGKHALLIFDEPTTGLHFDDVAMLLRVIQRLVDAGNSVLVIEHHLEVIKSADHVIDLGPDAGVHGGVLVAEGTPEKIAEVSHSHTGAFLKRILQKKPLRAAESSPITRRLPKVVSRDDDRIHVHGARENNLKNLDLQLPRDELLVVTGLSGSGKSTLAFDILFAEGQRRFLDSMSPYARQFTQQLEKAEVDLITGLPPTVAIEQRISRGGGKSTVATVTELYHFLRLLYSKVGVQHCPDCGLPVEKQSVSAIAASVGKAAKRRGVHLLAPLIKARKGFHTDVADWAGNHGYEMLFVDGEFKPVEGFQKLARFKEHTIDVVIADFSGPDKGMNAETLREKVDEALRIGKGTAKLRLPSGDMRILSSDMTCPECDRAFEELDPRLFSYNSPHGWCRVCRGYGQVAKQVTYFDDSRSESMLDAELQEEMRRGRADREDYVTCKACDGARTNDIARAVLLQGIALEEITRVSVSEASGILDQFTFKGRDALVSRDILSEVSQRLRFLDEVGLSYLCLDRSATTLSGGEAQRIRLAAQLGSNLRGVLYVLDEPTIGLHQRDNVKLLNTLCALRDQGNSLVVVEHDEETMRRSNSILDLGPGAGKFGGEVVAQGTLSQIQKNQSSVTGKALREPMVHPLRGKRRPIPGKSNTKAWLKIKGAHANNLKAVDVTIPLGRLVCISGISGSGKSSLMRGVIKPAVDATLSKPAKKKANIAAKTWKSISGTSSLAAVYEVDQSPIGKTSRSTPGTYVKVFDEIRKLFSGVPSARVRGYTASRFSYNTKGGRCDTCEGHGQIKMEMAFLPTSYVKCEDCQGLRYNAATLEIEYHGKNIGQVMQMTIDEAADFFQSNPKIHRSLRLLKETGTGYLQLGQPSPTLSGGEAQRIKLVTQLTKGVARAENARLRTQQKNLKTNLYLIEEPSIGLHMHDVRRLIDVLHQLVDDGHTVIVIEHNMDILAEADYLIDIGPEAGADGGTIVAAGTPEQVAKVRSSQTAPFLREILTNT